jgi:hypothetical protein
VLVDDAPTEPRCEEAILEHLCLGGRQGGMEDGPQDDPRRGEGRGGEENRRRGIVFEVFGCD